ncbi:hypothetical protein SVXHr_2726 [Halorhabdus sp. SVX81]|uniref:hypothetical protein n=1 Tax=Halorhabdus sp. SVX81 TaxID=2978283 RepID=UPI0023DB560D|nr:hypothetical protein [Halorhabdus sp. SVX81]WEL18869.1 hypothetical protein SVXHr_2726 [Halorhabdus sp. SVX81]
MPILTRNVTGADLLAIRKTVSDDGPITKQDILDLYFPGDASDPQTADQRKPIKDAIEFLIEVNQIQETDDGYNLTENTTQFDDAHLALLHGIRTAEDRESAYNNVMECLADQSDVLADRTGGLLDNLRDRVPDANWNEQKLRYWARVMEEIGVTKEVNGDEATTIFGPNRDLGLRILTDVAGSGTASLATVLTNIHEQYLPVLSEHSEVVPYFERTLLSLRASNDVQLKTISDIGQSVDIDGTSYSAIEVMANE